MYSLCDPKIFLGEKFDLMRYLGLFSGLIIILSWCSPSYAVETRSKPIQCGSEKTLWPVINSAGEKALIGGFSNVTTSTGAKEVLPVYLFANTQTKTWTIIEFHLESEEVCILGFGHGLDFDVAKYFEKKEEL